MGASSKIEWTDSTFNPWVGCTKIARAKGAPSACDFCYAEKWAKRSGQVRWANFPRRRTSADYWGNPIRWNNRAQSFQSRHGRRQRVFCASLADVFDNQVDPTWRSDLFDLIRHCDQLDWQLLTKRSQNIKRMLPPNWDDGYSNVWLGTTAEDALAYRQRVPHLLEMPAAIHFVSYEPAIGPLDRLEINGLCPDWLIIGGESGVRSDHASGGARKGYAGPGAAYIDVFCGPGRSKIRETGALIDGSPVAAFKKGQASPGPFTSIYVSDADDELLACCEKRLQKLNAPVHAIKGPASTAMPTIVRQLNPSGLHFAFLDPHNLGTLSFDLFETLARLKRIDVIVHVSLSDLQRNADRYTSEAHDQFDRFAPGWREHIRIDMNQERLRAEILKHWSKKVLALGLPQAKHCELIRGTNNQRLYWLIFLARHSLAHSLWSKISSVGKAPKFDF